MALNKLIPNSELKLVPNPQRYNPLVPCTELEAAEPVAAAGFHAEESYVVGGEESGVISNCSVMHADPFLFEISIES